MKKKSFFLYFHTLPALCRTFGAGECEKAENRWKWGGGSDTMRVIIRNNLSGIASQCHCPGCGTQHPQRFACVLLAAAPTATPCFRHWRRSSLLLLPRGGFGISENFASSPEAPLLGELSAEQTERLYEGKLTLCSTLFVIFIVFFTETPCQMARDWVK